MRKMLSIAIVFSLAFVLSSVSFAQGNDEGAAEAPMVIETVVEGEGVVDAQGIVDACGPVVPCGPIKAPCRPFFRRHGQRAFGGVCQSAPCAQPCCDPCVAGPRHCFPRRGWGAGCAAPCQTPCYDPGMGCDPCGDPCGYPMYRPTPIRNFFGRLFAPRSCGYDPCFGPGPYGYGYGGYDACGPCGYGSAPCAYGYGPAPYGYGYGPCY